MITDEMNLLSRLGAVEPLPAEVFERAETVVREAMVSPGPDRSLGRRRAQRRLQTTRPWRPRRLITGVAAAALVAGGGSYLAAGAASTHAFSGGDHVAQSPTTPAVPLHARVIAYVGSSPTLAVTSLPPGYHLDSSSQFNSQTTLPGGAPAVLPGGGDSQSKVFVGPGGVNPISVTEQLGGTAGTPEMITLAQQYPQAVNQVSVGGHPALLVDMSKVGAPDPAEPRARIVGGYVLYWSVGPHSWVMISGSPGTPSQLEQVAAGVAPAK